MIGGYFTIILLKKKGSKSRALIKFLVFYLFINLYTYNALILLRVEKNLS